MLIDNTDNRLTMADRIKSLCKSTKNLDIGVGYFYKDGFDKIKECLDTVDHVRIIMGTQTSQETAEAIYDLSTELGKKYNEGKIEIKIWNPKKDDKKTFHAKTWIFHEMNTAIIGSSNCSVNGLEQNKELNTVVDNLDEITEWYKDAWNIADDYDPKLLEISQVTKKKVNPIPIKPSKPNDYGKENKNVQTLWDYQKTAIKKVTEELRKPKIDKCKLIMACGTGKTLTSIRIMEEIVKDGEVLVYFVPSISLIPQTLEQFQKNGVKKYQYHAVCSDKQAGRVKDDAYSNLNIASSTDDKDLADALNDRSKKCPFIIFTVYNSWKVAVDGLSKASIKPKLALYDEAHRTTGKRDGFAGNALKKLKAEKKVFMTATPRVYKNTDNKEVNSMDNEEIYGKEAYKLSFTEAVSMGKLVDFKITLPEFKKSERQEDNIDFKDKRSAVWEGIKHPNGKDAGFNFLQRMIVFHSTINSSKVFSNNTGKNKILGEKAREFAMEKIIPSNSDYKVAVHHVDSTMSANDRRKEIEWLKKSTDNEKECRILSNARCLQEGVDVPSLDAVAFLDPKKSPVDIIQAIGRVMRKDDSTGKQHGYVILPIPTFGVNAETEMNKNVEYKIISNICSAILAHDEKLASLLNQTFLINTGGQQGREGQRTTKAFEEYLEKLIDKANPELVEYVRTVMLDLRDKEYYPRYGEKLGREAKNLEIKVNRLTAAGNSHSIVVKFHKELQKLINESIIYDDSIRVLCQHKVLKPVFDLLFPKSSQDNSVSAELDKTLAELNLTLPSLDYIYRDIDEKLKTMDDQAVKQGFIRSLYDSFFKGADENAAVKHGIVYTPVEVVDFINNSVEYMLKNEFNGNVSDEGVKIIDPFTGTGTFIARLLQSDLIPDDKLDYKYKNDIYANDIELLAYYTAQANIETVYQSIKKKYEPFTGISYIDTFDQNPFYRTDEKYRTSQVSLDKPFEKSYDRIKRQNYADLCVIIGNPPYFAGVKVAAKKIKITSHDFMKKRIKETYIIPGKSAKGMFNSYIKALRWSTDRIGKSGIVSFIIPSSLLVSNTMAGLRKSLHEDFSNIYIFDLLGNAKLKGEDYKKQGGKIFGSGSREPTCILVFVKNPNKENNEHKIYYKRIDKYLTTEQKLTVIKETSSISNIKDWEEIVPNKHHDWRNQPGEEEKEWENMMKIGSKDGKKLKTDQVLFKQYKLGLSSNRDRWVYNSSQNQLESNMKKMIGYCNEHYEETPFPIDSKHAKWNDSSEQKYKRFGKQTFEKLKISPSLYRPFVKQYLYNDKVFNDSNSVNEFYQKVNIREKESAFVLSRNKSKTTNPKPQSKTTNPKPQRYEIRQY